MKVCLICVEIFAWGKHGGYGRATRMIGRELAKRGIEVFAVVPRRGSQREVEKLDGITVLSFPLSQPWRQSALYRSVDANVYHSQEPSLGTYLAKRAMPHKKHLVTCRDPKTTRHWLTELSHPSQSRIQTLLAWGYENNLLVQKAVRSADELYYCARHLKLLVEEVYHPSGKVTFLPSPIEVPERPMVKSKRPTVCYLGRWDRRKRPQLFFELTRKHREIHFIAIGKSHDRGWEAQLRKEYASLPNLEMKGFVNQFETDEISKILERSWILVNTAPREGLPTSSLEAMAHGCALLSHVNPDGIAERFGYHVKENELHEGLLRLLDQDTWREKGRAGQHYVKKYHDLPKAVDQHIAAYQRAL